MPFVRTAAVAALSAVTLFAAGAPALAQQPAPPPAPRPVPVIVPQSGVENMSPFFLENERRTAIAMASAGRVKWERAVAVASLINSNRCKDAYLMAIGENDQYLAKRVYEICTAPPTPLSNN